MEFDDGGRARYVDAFGTVDTYERVEPAAPTVMELQALAGACTSDEIATTIGDVDGDRLVVHRVPRRSY